MTELLQITLLWGLTGTLLTFMDRVDEHNLVVWKWKQTVAFVLASLSAIAFMWSMMLSPTLYPFIFGMCIEWIFKNKLEYPSHVFFVFCIALYFGYTFSGFQTYYSHILLYLGLSYLIGTFLKKTLKKYKRFHEIFYKNYFSKILATAILSLAVGDINILVFGISFAYACLFIKTHFAGRNP